MHGNLVRISILLGIIRTSLNNVKVRCVGKDEYIYDSYVRNKCGVRDGDQEGVCPYRSWGCQEVRLGDSSYDRAWAEGEGGIVGEAVAFV